MVRRLEVELLKGVEARGLHMHMKRKIFGDGKERGLVIHMQEECKKKQRNARKRVDVLRGSEKTWGDSSTVSKSRGSRICSYNDHIR
jgi:hypothetical protein